MRRNAETLTDRCKARRVGYSKEFRQIGNTFRAVTVCDMRSREMRCTLKKGHAGPHLAPDDSEWKD